MSDYKWKVIYTGDGITTCFKIIKVKAECYGDAYNDCLTEFIKLDRYDMYDIVDMFLI